MRSLNPVASQGHGPELESSICLRPFRVECARSPSASVGSLRGTQGLTGDSKSAVGVNVTLNLDNWKNMYVLSE